MVNARLSGDDKEIDLKSLQIKDAINDQQTKLLGDGRLQ